MTILTASFRMYNAGPRAAAAWRALFERVFDEIGLAIDIVDASSGPIAELWGRPDLGCAFMCGWPFVRSVLPMQVIAAPVPAPARYDAQPRYCSEFLAREKSGWTRLEESFGHRFGWMSGDSQSGFNAPRAYLASLRDARRPRLFGEVRGPLGTPASALDALRGGEVDVVALDGFYLDLSRRYQPEAVAGFRTLATTPWTPIPLLVAAEGVDPSVVEMVRARLLSLHESPAYESLLADVLLLRFVAPDLTSYAWLERMAIDSVERGYSTIQ